MWSNVLSPSLSCMWYPAASVPTHLGTRRRLALAHGYYHVYHQFDMYIYIYINKGHRSVVALKAKKPACGGAERGLRMNMNELIIWGLPGPSGFVWKCLTPSSNEFQWIVIFATNVAANFSGLLDADAPLGAMARSWEASSAPFRFLGQWDAIENMIYQKLIMVYGSLWQFMTVMLYQISNLCIFMWQVGVPWFLGTLTGSK